MFFTRSSGVCVAFQGGTNLDFHHNDIFECGRDGILTCWEPNTVMHDLRIHHNRFYMLGDDAISVQGHDGVGVQNGTAATVSTTAGSPNVVGTGTSWQAGDVGKRISIENGGAGGVIPFESIITVVTDSAVVFCHF